MVPRSFVSLLLCSLALWALNAAEASAQTEPRIESLVSRTQVGEWILLQEVELEAPVAEVWKAHTTNQGWTLWASPVAEIDLRVGGTIQTHYDANASIGSPGTNTLHIVNYVPERLLTLKAELQPNWPEVMKQDGDRLVNVILFESLTPTRTRLESYGIGYGDSPEYEELLQFFLTANEALYAKLVEALAPPTR